jgi:hypothetical protein
MNAIRGYSVPVMGFVNGLLFIIIVAGTLGLLIMAGRRERRMARQYQQELLDMPPDPIDRAVTKKEELDPLAQTRRPLGQTFPVRAQRAKDVPPPETAPTQVESIDDNRDAPG